MVGKLALLNVSSYLYMNNDVICIMSSHTLTLNALGEMMMKFSEIKSRDDLALILNIPLKKLTYMLYIKKTENYYYTFEIPKKNGESRQINAPQDDLKDVQGKLADALWNYHSEYINANNIQMNVSHAFEKKKGIITNASVHRNKRYVLNMDLENYFDSFHFGRVRGFFEKNREFNLPIKVATVIAQLTCYKGCLPQGAPSSPIITNLICNVLDMRLIKISHKYKLNYTRYADDMTFSTNDSKFIDLKESFIKDVTKEVEKLGFSINKDKTRLAYKDSRQEVTGLVVNKKVNVNKEYCKKTRAMADTLYRQGEFKINDCEGSIRQLEGRFSFINQIDYYNNKNDHDSKQHSIWRLNSREKQYQKFLFYKYFFANSKPLIVTEGKTDVLYLKAALKKNYSKYPQLVTKNGNKFEFNISFLSRTKHLKYFLDIQLDGADTMKNIYNLYQGTNNYPAIYKFLQKKSSSMPHNPVILVFDNEQESNKPLKKFIDHAKIPQKPLKSGCKIIDNLYLVTNPLVNGMKECEIEDLFDETVLLTTIGGKIFSRDKDADNNRCYGKEIFSEYIMKNYQKINFSEFIPILDDFNAIINSYNKQ